MPRNVDRVFIDISKLLAYIVIHDSHSLIHILKRRHILIPETDAN